MSGQRKVEVGSGDSSAVFTRKEVLARGFKRFKRDPCQQRSFRKSFFHTSFSLLGWIAREIQFGFSSELNWISRKCPR